jgi:hypothetical protein
LSYKKEELGESYGQDIMLSIVEKSFELGSGSQKV